MADGAPLLELDGVSKRFGPVQALDRVDFAVNEGEVVGLVGDNGAGKSTMVKTIAGIHGADSGTIPAEGSWEYTVRQKGEFAYTCTYHPTMKATLNVK